MRLYIYKVEVHEWGEFAILVIAKNRNQADRMMLEARGTIYDWSNTSFEQSLKVDPKANKVGLVGIYGWTE